MAFNEVIAPSYKVERKGGNLVIEGYREGELVKIDRVNIYDLDMETLKISSVDSTVSVKCYSDLDGCVARTLTKERNKKSYRNRVVFGIEEGKSGEEIAEKLRLLIGDLAKKN
jgi:intergrase/recombinase